MNRAILSATASAFALMATVSHAQTQPLKSPATAAVQSDEGQVSEVIVTGTRTTGLKAIDSSAPVQVLDNASLKRVGQPDLISSLAQNVPSFTSQALGGDAANLTLSARLRGLSPNDTLVLVDGKRRHGTANLAVLGGPYQGGAAPDLNFIPVNSIDHVEVLTDGAAAQYGTDAIAGVVNIILKKNNSGGNITASGGQYFDGGGDTGDINGNIGFAPTSKSFVNITAESRFHGHSNQGNIDPRIYNHDGINNVGPGGPNVNALQVSGYPYLNQISGDALYHLNIISYNAGYDFGDGLEAYSFGTYGHKNGQAYENYRVPNVGGNPFVPFGFSPKEELDEDDFGVTIGVRGKLYGWNLDLSSTYGQDIDAFSTEGTANNTLAATQGLRQNLFYDGKFIASQTTTNLDASRDFNVGMASPLTVAAGIEERHDTYELGAGEPNSYNGSGAASFPGLQPVNAGHHSRDNTGVYIDLALSPIPNLKVDGAARYEHYTDFGDTTVGKVTARYDFTPEFAVRGTVSNGFRAPTLAEEFYSNVNVGPHSAFGQLGPDAAATASLGVGNLKPEESTNLSIGIVSHPIRRLTVTVDAYDIVITNRIVGSGNIYATGNPAGVNSAAAQATLLNFAGAAALAGDTMTGINIFANGINTRTAGAEFVATYSSDYDRFGHVDWSLTGSYNDTKVTKVKPSPPSIAPQALYDPTALSILEDASPKFRVVGAGLWTHGPFTVNLRESLYGESHEKGVGDDGVTYKTRIDPTVITDLEIAWRVRPDVRIAVGANNLFDQFPDKNNAAQVASYRMANDNAAVGQYPDFSPFGINGGYYYGRVTYEF